MLTFTVHLLRTAWPSSDVHGSTHIPQEEMKKNENHQYFQVQEELLFHERIEKHINTAFT